LKNVLIKKIQDPHTATNAEQSYAQCSDLYRLPNTSSHHFLCNDPLILAINTLVS